MIMKKIIMLKYAELNTKKDNINMFLKTLKTVGGMPWGGG